MRSARPRFARVLGLAAALLLGAADPARPHAVPLEYWPDPATALSAPPDEVVVRYSERPDPRVSSLRVLDATGARVDAGDAAPVPADPYRLRVRLERRGASDVYTVVWRVLSADDGHFTEGAYVLAVAGASPAAPPGGAATARATARPPVYALGRLLVLAGEALLAAALLGPAILSRRWRDADVADGLVVAAWATLLAGAALVVGDLALAVADGEGLGAGVAQLAGTGVARVWMGRVALDSFAAAAAVAATLVPHASWSSGLRAAALACLGGAVTTAGLASHGAAATALPAVALSARAIHLGAALVWLGGLAWFASRFWSAARDAAPLPVAIPAFSLAAIVAVGLLVASGTYLARLEVGAVRDLVGTAWGRVLAAKLLVLVVMLALAVRHRGAAYRRIIAASTGDPAGPATPTTAPAAVGFRRTLRVEAALGVAGLALAGLLAALPSPRARAASPPSAFRHVAALHEGALTLQIAPLRPGPSRVQVAATRPDGTPLADATAAMLLLEPADGAAAPSHVPLAPAGPGRFTAIGPLLGMAGTWRVKVIVQRADAFDLAHRLEIHVPPAASVGGGAGAPLDAVMLAVTVGLAGACAVAFAASRRDLARASARLVHDSRPAERRSRRTEVSP